RHRPDVMKGDFIQPIWDPDFRPEIVRNTLCLNRGDGTYAEIAQLSGVAASDWSWSAIFLDVDLDGYEDLLVATGNDHDVLDADVLAETTRDRDQSPGWRVRRLRKLPPLNTPCLAFRNLGNLTFTEVGAAWGFNTRGVSQGMALADLDNDGDLDVVINRLNRPAGIYRNNTIAPRVAVRLKGKAPNTRGVGAKIELFGGAVPRQSQEMICGGRYLSADDNERVFAAGAVTNRMRLVVTWRSGRRSVLEDVQANRIYEVDEAGARAVRPAPRPEPHPCFEDVSDRLNHAQQAAPFDDFARQELLSRKLSQLGPGLTWYDVNGDGWDDLIIGAGRGSKMAVFLNNRQGGFSAATDPLFDRTLGRAQTSILGWRSLLLAGSANYEDGLTNGGLLRIYDLRPRISGQSVLGQSFSCGPLAMADVDGDGVADLFIGGRVRAGRYPEPVPSMLLRNDGSRFLPAQRWDKLGLVSGAVFSDLDGDGYPELILACEWGPIRIFHNDHGRFTEWNPPVQGDALPQGPTTLSELTGWWNGVTTGDFDGDGRLDIVASNWGRNTKYQRYLGQPLEVYYGAFGGGDALDVLEAEFDPELGKTVPVADRDTLFAALPAVQERFASYRAYSRASVAELLGNQLPTAARLTVRTLDSMVLLNRGDHFEARALPIEAQFAPAFGVTVADFDGDGQEDIFLAQNFFAVDAETSRYDAGRGLWLRNDGRGGFTAVPGQESGVRIYGQQRGAAVCDYDGDGRVDLVVAQHQGPTRLYHNVGAKPGLRVRLVGPPGNPDGLGAVMRLRFGDRWGPAREVHGGSGYWSEDSVVQVLGTPARPTQIWIRWPGGRVTTSTVPVGAREMVVNAAGQIKGPP
ncbi:MAG: VCBS repeat-containing protein, partial [Verrucomicrobia bacterium]|nr:VCBS repeat-containing protein [Verrucomicrobiota bacterium]